MNPQEIEAKFYVTDLSRIKKRLREMKAQLIQPRMHEANIRYDTPEKTLRKQGHVLRLRMDNKARMTYKGPSSSGTGSISRTEIEFVVEDFELANVFLESLGFKKLFYYEKYRATYQMGKAHIMLDELPFGSFIEIEGTSEKQIKSTAAKLGLKWDTAVDAGYHALFDRIRKKRHLKFNDLAFKSFSRMKITAEDMDVQPADG
jgi:adenylate cyclase class 2